MSGTGPALRIVFAGTPDFAVPTLERLLSSRHRLVSVYCQPDRPAGRGRQLRPCAVKRRAQTAGIPLQQPQSLRDGVAAAVLAAMAPDLMVVVAYGQLLPLAILAIPRLGCINLHASLLPRWRGAAPIQRAILAGDRETGVCVMQLETGLDTGPVYACRPVAIARACSAATLHDVLAQRGAELVAEVVESLAFGAAVARPQTTQGVTYARKIEKAEAEIDWNRTAEEIERQVRAFIPWPVAQTRHGQQVLRIWQAIALTGEGPPGQVLTEAATGIDVACGHGILRLTQLQLPGGRPMPVEHFLNAHSLATARLG